MNGVSIQERLGPFCPEVRRTAWLFLLVVLAFTLTPAQAEEGDIPTVISGLMAFRGDQMPSRASVSEDGTSYIEFPDQRPTIDIRYRIFLLLGEPVATYEARFTLPRRIHVVRNNEIVMELRERRGVLGNSVRSVEHDGRRSAGFADRWIEVRVPSEMFESIRLSSFRFRASAFQSIGGTSRADGYPIIDLAYPGITGRVNEWGWDVPGAPGWDRLFRHGGFPPGADGRASWMPAESAKRQFLRLARRSDDVNIFAGAFGRGPLNVERIEDLRFDMWYLMNALRDDVPNIFGYYYGRPRDREATEFVSALTSNRNSDPQSQARNARIIQQTLESLGTDVSPELASIVQEFANAPVIAEAEKELQDLQQQLFREFSQSGLEDLQNQEAYLKQLDELEARLTNSGIQRDAPIFQQAQKFRETLSSGDHVWIVAKGYAFIPIPSPSLVLLTGTRRGEESLTEQERRAAARRAEQRRQERLAREREAWQIREQRNTVLREGWVRTVPIRISASAERVENTSGRRVSDGELYEWAETQLKPHVINREDWRAHEYYNVWAFSSEQEAREWAEGQEDFRQVEVAPPTLERLE